MITYYDRKLDQIDNTRVHNNAILFKVYSSKSQRLWWSGSGLRGAISCVKMILHAPSKPFFYNLSLMNLDIVILEYGHDMSYMVI